MSHVLGTCHRYVAVVSTTCAPLHIYHWAVTARSSHQGCKLEDSEVQTSGLGVPQHHGQWRGWQGRVFALMARVGECCPALPLWWGPPSSLSTAAPRSRLPSPPQSPWTKPLVSAPSLATLAAAHPQHGGENACLRLGPKVNLLEKSYLASSCRSLTSFCLDTAWWWFSDACNQASCNPDPRHGPGRASQ